MKSLDDYTLPQWLKDEIGVIRDSCTLDAEGGLFVLKEPNGEILIEDADLEVIHNFVHDRDLRANLTDDAVKFAESIPELSVMEDDFFFKRISGEDFSLMIHFSDDRHDLRVLEEAYEDHLARTKDLEAQKDSGEISFKTAYEYVNEHPLFWYKNKSVLDRWNEDRDSLILLWITEIDVMDRAYPSFNADDGSHVWYVEGGSTVREQFNEYEPPAFTHHYFDPDITGRGATIEEAVIDFALKVHATGEE